MSNFIGKILTQIDEKILIKKNKVNVLHTKMADTYANAKIKEEIDCQFNKEKLYLLNKKEELNNLDSSIKKRSVFILNCLPCIMATIAKAKVHPVHYQEELHYFQKMHSIYMRKI